MSPTNTNSVIVSPVLVMWVEARNFNVWACGACYSKVGSMRVISISYFLLQNGHAIHTFQQALTSSTIV